MEINKDKTIKDPVTGKTRKNKDGQKKFLVKNFSSVVFLSIIVIGILFYWLLFAPVFKAQDQYNETVLQNKTKEYETKKGMLNELQEANEIYNKISPDLKEKLIEILPYTPDLPDIFNNFEQLALASDFEILSLDAVPLINNKKVKAEVGKNDKIKEIKINIVIQGSSYVNFKKFLDLIEHNLRIFDVESYVYAPEETKYSLVLKTYFYED